MSHSEPNLRQAVARSRRLSVRDVAQEPFRIFFPAGFLAGLLGVLLWPLHLKGLVAVYPGICHARLMAHGFFGGFILGFLGTALPRMLSAKPFRIGEVLVLLGLYGAMVLAYVGAKVPAGDGLLLTLLVVFGCLLTSRIRQRRDMPPPGFVLVALAFACLATGTVLSLLLAKQDEPAMFWVSLQRLLSYQGFVLLPILGVGAFIIPRFFNLPNQQDFPESRTPPPGWTAKAGAAAAAGALILVSFVVEAAGGYRLGAGVRLAVIAIYLAREIPIHRAPGPSNALASSLKVAFALLLSGFLAILLDPTHRIAVLHLTLIGGFAVITLTIATRVVFGHSGNRALFTARNRWLKISVALMLFAMVTRISGDFWPAIMASHYIYGALLWAGGALLWAGYVLPKVLRPDPDE